MDNNHCDDNEVVITTRIDVSFIPDFGDCLPVKMDPISRLFKQLSTTYI